MQVVVGRQVETWVAVAAQVEPPQATLAIDDRAAGARVRVAERLEYSGGVGEGETASGHRKRRAGTDSVEELGLGGTKVLQRALEGPSRAGRLHHLVILD